MVETVFEDGDTDEIESYFKAVGEDRFWNEILPQEERRHNISGQLIALTYSEMDSMTQEEMHSAILKWQVERFKNVKVKFTGRLDIGATPEQALEYLLHRVTTTVWPSD